jgi:hypothetical protein
MKINWSAVWQYLLLALGMSFKQLIFVFAVLLVLAYVMQLVAKQLENQSLRLVGRNAFIYLFAWIGVPIHELGHLVFCWIFRHSVTDIVLFQKDSGDGTMGYVNHSYNPGSTYQMIGNFFIGIGPIFSGSVAIYLLSHYLLGVRIADFNTDQLVNLNTGLKSLPGMFGSVVLPVFRQSITVLWEALKTGGWKSIVFVYVSFSIGTSITLSPADIKHLAPGFISLVMFLMFFNLATVWMGSFSLALLSHLQVYLNMIYAVLLLVLCISVPILLLFYALNLVLRR